MTGYISSVITSQPKHILSVDEATAVYQYFSEQATNYEAYRKSFRKVVYSQQLCENQHFVFLRDKVKSLLDGPHVFINDIYLEVDEASSGFPWHCDRNNVQPLANPYDAVSVWIALSNVSEVSGGRILTATDEVAQAVSRMIYLMSDVEGLGFKKPWVKTMLANLTYSECGQEMTLGQYLARVGVAHNMSVGEGMLFNNALFHKTEAVRPGCERLSYILRFVRGDRVRLSRKRLDILKQWGKAPEHVARYESLLKEGRAILEAD